MLSGPSAPRLRIASVSYLNARPLIEGLDAHPEVELSLDVPARLLEGLRGGRCDVALLPVIDYQRMEGLTVVPAGGIGCDGPTLTVRVFSRVPIEGIQSLACDPDSHTSVALARVILAKRYGLRPEFIDLGHAGGGDGQARLLIGDKVVCQEPSGFAHQLDLGSAWKELTGLPFVFATWMAAAAPPEPLADATPAWHGRPAHAPPDLLPDLRRVFEILDRARSAGLARIESIVRAHAIPRGWPIDLARQYLTSNLKYDIGPRELEAIRLFHRLSAEEGVLQEVQPLRVWGAVT